MFDIFYNGKSPAVPGAKSVHNLQQALNVSKTRYFWWVHYLADLNQWDFLWEPPPWQKNQRHAWLDQFESDSGIYLVPAQGFVDTNYHTDSQVQRLGDRSFWYVPPWIDPQSIDWTWSPHPCDPPYIYHFPVEWGWDHRHGAEYRVPGATESKFVTDFVCQTMPDTDPWQILLPCNFDLPLSRWRPNPDEPPMIYVWGNQWHPAEIEPTVEYRVPGATDRKYMTDSVTVTDWQSQCWRCTTEVQWDFSWRPNPYDPPYIYVWGNAWVPAELESTVEYHTPGATERKYMSELVSVVPQWDRWHQLIDIDTSSWDFTWRPDPREPAMIYVWGNQWNSAEIEPTVEYRMPGATERKYMTDRVAIARTDDQKWQITHAVDQWDFSWRPNPYDPPYIYVWGNAWVPAELEPTVEYHVAGAHERKYMSELLPVTPQWDRWHQLIDIDTSSWDFTWRPDPREPAMIYVWGNQWHPAEIEPTVEYRMPGATERKYMTDRVAIANIDTTRWQITHAVDQWDFSWRPNPYDPPYIYVWGNAWVPPELQATLEYHTPGATERKYMSELLPVTPQWDRWHQLIDIDTSSWDFTWRPDPREPAMIYVWGNQWHSAETMPSIEYHVPGATDRKYMTDRVAMTKANITMWKILLPVDNFDFSWIPDPYDPPYIYVWGNQWHPAALEPTVEYHVPGATARKYLDQWHATVSCDSKNWHIPEHIDPHSVDCSWRPDPTAPPYIYEFGTQHQPNGGARYLVPGATEIKYVSEIQHHALPSGDHWHIPEYIDPQSVDCSWRPDSTAPPYIYEFGTQHQPNGGARYLVPGATEIKYVSEITNVRLPSSDHWHIPEYIDPQSVDRSWHPDATELPYIYEFGTQHQPNGGARYLVPGATEIKYVSEITNVRLPSSDHWHIPDCIDPQSVDRSWHPDATEPAYIYEFGTQHQPNGGARYLVPGATEIKYVSEITNVRLPSSDHWHELHDITDFDYSWHPDSTEPAYVYVFGNQHWAAVDMPTVELRMPGAVEKKFVDHVHAKLGPRRENWQMLESIDHESWDWSWIPNPHDPPYIYVWGNQWHPSEIHASVTYTQPGATERKYMTGRAQRLPAPEQFVQHIAVEAFDWSWHPDPTDPPYRYVFGNQWHAAEIEPTVEYVVGMATEIKYIHSVVAQVRAEPTDRWHVIDSDPVTFDWSWRPDPNDPPMIYVFGNQWFEPQQRASVEYRVPGATARKYLSFPRAQRQGQKARFLELYPCDFDWSWEPDPYDPPYIYVWGNQWHSAEQMPTLEYRVPGATERKYMNKPARLLPCDDHWHALYDCEWDRSWRPDPGTPPYIYVFGNNWWAAEKMPTVEYRVPGATERKYMSEPRAMLSASKQNWQLPGNIDAHHIDFSWRPDPGERPYIYQFPTQHQKTGGARYVVPGASTVKYMNHMQVETSSKAVPVIEIDHLDGHAGQIANTLRRVRYVDNYRDTLIRIAKTLDGSHEFVWICSSLCDYSGFDFSWHPEQWQREMLHVFASDEQKFGDTFFMHVPSFAQRAEKKQQLEWYAVNFVPRIRVPRRELPVFEHSEDSHVDAVKQADFRAPLALFTVDRTKQTAAVTVNLWRDVTKTVTPLLPGAAAVIVPRIAVPYIREQLYDYPHVDLNRMQGSGDPLDIVFVSAGEICAEENYQWLCSVTAQQPNRVVRSADVQGRVAAFHSAAALANTAWFFAVFAKLRVNADFNWQWQPDRMQQAKHYIFHASNPVNGLEYGHQAMVAYNRRLVLNNAGVGLDFTLDSPHQVIPLVSGVATYDKAAGMCWRTAFRETLKLMASLPDVENEYRLHQWLTQDSSEGQWSRQGAQDAQRYFASVNGDPTMLRLSYEWQWLQTHARDLGYSHSVINPISDNRS